MGKLRDQMIMEMELRNHSPKTIKAYIRHVKNFTRLFNKSPAEMGTDEIRKYLHHLERKRLKDIINPLERMMEDKV